MNLGDQMSAAQTISFDPRPIGQRPCPSCGHCPTCGHVTPRPQWFPTSPYSWQSSGNDRPLTFNTL